MAKILVFYLLNFFFKINKNVEQNFFRIQYHIAKNGRMSKIKLEDTFKTDVEIKITKFFGIQKSLFKI